jgi:hypothetical protein
VRIFLAGLLSLVLAVAYLCANTELKNFVDPNAVTFAGGVFHGEIRLGAGGTAFEDSLASANTAIRSGATDISYNDTLGGQAFAASATTSAANDHLTFTYQTPHRRKSGSNLYPHLHFYQDNVDQTNCWYISYAWVDIGGTNVVDQQLGPGSNTQQYVSGVIHQLCTFPPLDGTGKGISGILRVKLYRYGSRGTGSITVTDLDCHYVVDGFGSEQEASKAY